jgi:hypothetical protein
LPSSAAGTAQHSGTPSVADNAILVQAFLEENSAMLTHYGLIALHETVFEHEYAVLFFNNHFSVLTKHENHLYMLVTDAGYAGQPRVIWERLSDVDGNTAFCDAQFNRATPKSDAKAVAPASSVRPADPATTAKPVTATAAPGSRAGASSSNINASPKERLKRSSRASRSSDAALDLKKSGKGSKGCCVQ